jgi:hypothetical protein
MPDSDTEAMELDRLAAELRVVSQSPALAGRRNVGGATARNLGEGRDTSGVTIQGMSVEEQEGVNLETVTDMEIESLVTNLRPGEETVDMFGTTEEGSRTSTTKKSRIYLVPTDTEAYDAACFKLVGAGAVFCTAVNCTVAHRGGAVMSVKVGDIFVAKSFSEAFVEPRMSSFNIDEQALQEWLDLSLSFEAWSEKFLMASAAGDDEPASSAAMEVQEDFYRNKALTFKTPAKRKRTLDEDTLELVSAVPYSPLFKDDEDLVLGDLSEVSGLLSRFDQSFLSMNETIISFLQDYKLQTDKASVAISSLWFRMESMSRLLGSRPTVMPTQYQAPSAWASIGELADKVDDAHTRSVSPSEVDRLLTTVKAELKSHLVERLSLVQSTLGSKSQGLRTFVVDVARSLGKRVATLEENSSGNPPSSDVRGDAFSGLNQDAEVEGRLLKLESLMDGMAACAFGENLVDGAETATKVTARIEKRIETMDLKLGKLFAKGDDLAIKFAGLGFTKPPDANSWLEKELPHHPAGLIVDAHMVFERIFYNMDNTDTLARLQQCYKIKVTTIADGVAITSFDSKIPKFFSRSHGHKVVKADGSFLDSIASYQEWDDPGTGYRLRLLEELSNFEDIHGTYLEEYFSYETGQGYSISRLALTESMGWIEGFITFIDTYYRELTKAKFGSAKAWHVTTRLAKRVLDDVGTIRQSAQGGFEAGNAVKICQNIVWAVLKAHDTMSEYKRLSFKNHPSVATELVKFLAINTSFEAIEKLVNQTKVLECEVCEMKKQVAASVKASASAANKADEVRKQGEVLSKRVTRLEK